ncbi:MAG: hypothetical protein AAGF12_24970 [Myxococcota bacterium]
MLTAERVFVAAVLCLGPAASFLSATTSAVAQPSTGGFVVPGADEALADRLEAELSDTVQWFTAEQARSRLQDAAGSEMDAHEAAIQSTLEAAERAYVQYDTQEARAQYRRARDLILQSSLGIVERRQLAPIYFGLSQCAIADGNPRDAVTQLRIAFSIYPEYRPLSDAMTPPMMRALEDARRRIRRAPTRRLTIDRAPADAVVLVNGVVVSPDQRRVEVTGSGPHLVTATAPGYSVHADLVETDDANTRVAIVLQEASDTTLAGRGLRAWREASSALSAASLRGHVADSVAAGLGYARLLEVSDVNGALRAELRELPEGDLLASSSGRDPATMAGELVVPDSASVSLSITAPERVAPGDGIHLRLSLQDPDAQVRRLLARCGDARAERAFGSDESPQIQLVVDAPPHEGSVECAVRAEDARGRLLIRAPPPGQPLEVSVEESSGGGLPWWGWTAIVAVVAAAAGVAIYFALPERNVLRVQVSDGD